MYSDELYLVSLMIYCAIYLDTHTYSEELSSKLSKLLWPISVTSDPWPVCVHYYDEAFVFSLPHPNSESVHFSLLVNTLLPLYSLMSLRDHFGPHSVEGYDVVLMPTLEMYGVKVREFTCW